MYLQRSFGLSSIVQGPTKHTCGMLHLEPSPALPFRPWAKGSEVVSEFGIAEYKTSLVSWSLMLVCDLVSLVVLLCKVKGDVWCTLLPVLIVLCVNESPWLDLCVDCSNGHTSTHRPVYVANSSSFPQFFVKASKLQALAPHIPRCLIVVSTLPGRLLVHFVQSHSNHVLNSQYLRTSFVGGKMQVRRGTSHTIHNSRLKPSASAMLQFL